MSRRRLAIAFAAAIAAAAITTASPEVQLTRALATQELRAAEHPEDPSVLNDLGNLQLRAGLHDDAMASYRKALEIDPEAATPRFNLALLLHQQGERRQALKELDRLVEAAPNHARAHYQRGVLLEARGSRDAAIRAYSRAFRLDPQLTLAKVNPQIIDSALTVQALLSAFGDDLVFVEAPRVYQNPDQIYELLTEPSPQSAPSPAALEEEEEEERSAAPSTFSSASSSPTADEQARVLGPAELDDVNRAGGQATPPVPNSRQSAYATRMSQRLAARAQAPASRQTPTARGSAAAPATRSTTLPNASGGYRPSRLSTGRLEIELFDPPTPATTPS